MRKIRFILVICMSSLVYQAKAQTEKDLKSEGIYKDINISNDLRREVMLMNNPKTAKMIEGLPISQRPPGYIKFDPVQQEKLADSIKRSPNVYTPPVLYGLAYYFEKTKRINEAMYWFYLAQLRARYDVNRCADTTVTASGYNFTIGLFLNQYAMQHIDTLKKIVERVIAFERANDELYDQRWINIASESVSGINDDNKSNLKEPFSLPKDQWPAIKKKTVDDYWSDFQKYVINKQK